MRIGILKCGHFSGETRNRLGDVDALFRDMFPDEAFDFTTYDVEHGTLPKQPNAEEGYLITGSKHGAYENHAFIPVLEDFIRQTHSAEIPMVGICFGHQIVAQALGGRVEKFDEGWSLGATDYDYGPFGEMRLNAWHQDQVIEPPAGARTLASGPRCAHAALAYGTSILTLQAHPEFEPEVIKTFVAGRRGTADYPDDRMDAALSRAETALDNTRARRLIADFLKGQADV